MALIREIVSSAVHWRLTGSNPTNSANDMLVHMGLPANLLRLFARLNVNGYKYEWHAEGTWRPLKDANPTERATVLALVESARRDIMAYGRGHGDKLVKLPNDDDYIFFRSEATGTQILFTGWGFESARRINGDGVKIKEQKPPQNVRIAFASDGQLQPNHQFILAYNGNANERVTDDSGFFTVGPTNEDTAIAVTDSLTARTFNIVVKSGQQDYICDITQKASVIVRLMRDGQPCTTEELVTLSYNGSEQRLTAAAGQEVEATFTHKPGEEASVTALGEEQRRVLLPGVNEFLFNNETPRADLRVRMTHADGTPYVAEQVSVAYTDKNLTIITDDKGEATLTLEYAQGQPCVVTTGIGSAQRQLRPAYEELFEFTEEPVVLPDFNLRFIDGNERPHSNINVTFGQNGKEWATTLDDEGRTSLPHDLFATAQPIDITMHCPDQRIDGITLTLDDDEYEYLIQTKEPEPASNWWKWLLLALLILALTAAACYGLHHACKALEPWAMETFTAS